MTNTFTKKLTTYEKNFICYKLTFNAIKNTTNSIEFMYKKDGYTITIYKNNTLLIQGVNADEWFSNVLMKKKSETSLTKNIINKDKIPTNTIEEYQSYIGSDEVGVGDYFGGLVVCAVYIDKKDEAKLKELGVKDSKDLTDLQMEYMYPEIIKIVKYSFLSYMPSQYNAFISKYKNTHILKAYMHNNCICRLNKKLNIQAHAVIDQFVNSDKYYSYFKELNIEPYTDITFEPKAENKYVAVACASIIARVEFLMQIKVIKKLLKIDFPLGSSDKRVIECAKYVYENYGKEGLYNNVKIDFKTTDKVISKK